MWVRRSCTPFGGSVPSMGDRQALEFLPDLILSVPAGPSAAVSESASERAPRTLVQRAMMRSIQAVGTLPCPTWCAGIHVFPRIYRAVAVPQAEPEPCAPVRRCRPLGRLLWAFLGWRH